MGTILEVAIEPKNTNTLNYIRRTLTLEVKTNAAGAGVSQEAVPRNLVTNPNNKNQTNGTQPS